MELQELEAKYQELDKGIKKLKADGCEYPKFFRHKQDGYVVKFLSLDLGNLLTGGEIDKTYMWTPHTDTMVWEEVPYDKETGFYHTQLVWCWGNNEPHKRQLRFYDAINKCTFYSDGLSNGFYFDNYEPYDWSCDFINNWAVEAVKTLKDK